MRTVWPSNNAQTCKGFDSEPRRALSTFPALHVSLTSPARLRGPEQFTSPAKLLWTKTMMEFASSLKTAKSNQDRWVTGEPSPRAPPWSGFSFRTIMGSGHTKYKCCMYRRDQSPAGRSLYQRGYSAAVNLPCPLLRATAFGEPVRHTMTPSTGLRG